MATYNKFNDYVEQLNRGVHNWGAHEFKVALSNVAPVATNTVLGNITQIANGAGYTGGAGGGYTLDTVTLTEVSGLAKVTIADEVITAVGGTMATFRYIVIYNNTPTSPVDPLVCWFDYGGVGVSLLNGETFTIDFDPSAGLWQLQ